MASVTAPRSAPVATSQAQPLESSLSPGPAGCATAANLWT